MTDLRFAFDRSSRTIDGDGHLHVASSVITRACVSPYQGREIPNYQVLGLDANKTYMLLRDPEELKRAAPTLAGKPLMTEHVPISADSHRHRLVVGAVANPVWKNSELCAELTVWDGFAIDAIQDGSERSLSAAYKYTPVMTPGTFNGTRYDGVMRNIEFNHVALVSEPRVLGAMVGDSKPKYAAMKRMFVMDEDGSIDPNDDVFTQMCKFLKDKISPEDMTGFQTLWKNANDLAQDDLDENGLPMNALEKKQAMDSRRRSNARAAFATRFPEIAAVKRV